ncbi:co-chaperone protein HscB [Shewanella sp. NFH-SH190041]|uniref:co-chaperone HscB n=1 Tax=Shewanella sp. NFH-SH190041 TaxID=2950245 RepID=UPI0021C2FED2|nr:co-chaperone HscB [Shewanella sp. NFH-SH190041]BDM63927.1 co-chaperone protein HscB [Shewanella sp. NFH-SH190041]
MNYFELFDLPLSFKLDTGLLSDRYRELQRAVHPDKFAGGSEQEVLLAVQKAAQINDGYQTLKQPLRRAEHMLALRGLDISGETATVKDTAFLMQQMEWREALEDIGHSQQPEVLIDELHSSFSAYEKVMFANLAELLLSTSEPDALKAADDIRKLKFMAKLQDELARAEDALFE